MCGPILSNLSQRLSIQDSISISLLMHKPSNVPKNKPMESKILCFINELGWTLLVFKIYKENVMRITTYVDQFVRYEM